MNTHHPHTPRQVPTRCDCKAGDWIEGRYVVASELGAGSFGQVFKVKDANGNTYALKLLRLWDVPAEIREPLIERFDMEIKTGQIPCPNLVHSIDTGYLNGNPWFVMEFCAGGDISKRMGDPGADFPRYAREILTGLHALHVNGKVHRDLKPENVLLKEGDVAALTDFGISGDRNRRMTERNIFGRPQQMFGTYAYMPPEQSNRARGDCTVLPTTDIFSFGVVIYQLITGELPFGKLEDENDLAKYLIKSKAGDWDRHTLMSVPNGGLWEPLIAGCLEASWKQRIQSAEEAMRRVPNYPVAGRPQEQALPEPEPLQFAEEPEPGHPSGAYIKIMQGEEFGKEYALDQMLEENKKQLVTVGRDYLNQIFLLDFSDSYCSRRHFTLEKVRDGGWIVRDGQWVEGTPQWGNSTNGTYVGSKEVDEFGEPLKSGDIISAGNIKVRFKIYQ